MNWLRSGPISYLRQLCPPITWLAMVLVTLGLLLGVTVHKGFLILLVCGALGPNLLRQLGVLNDFDELQREAATRAGMRAYLAATAFLMLVVIVRGWNHLSFSNDQVPASTIAAMLLVVYYSSYCLSFWDARQAVPLVLVAFGLFWLVFVILSHAGEGGTLAVEALVVPGPFLLGALLCRWWPRTIGFLLLCACVGAIVLFRLLPIGSADPELFMRRAFVFVLVPLPLAISSLALLAVRQDAAHGE